MWSAAQRASASPVTLPVPPSDEGKLLKKYRESHSHHTLEGLSLCREELWSGPLSIEGLGPELGGRKARGAERGLEEGQASSKWEWMGG